MSEASVPASQPAESGDVSASSETQEHHHRRLAQLFVLTAAVLCAMLCWWAGRLMDVPAYHGYQASLLLQPAFVGKITAVLTAAVMFVVCVILAQLIAGRHWLFAGLFGGAVGLIALSCRGGPARYTFSQAASNGMGRSVFLLLLIELLLLSAAAGGVWYLLVRRVTVGLTPAKAAKPQLGTRFQGVGMQAVLTALLVMLLAPTDLKKQVVAAVFIASFVATSVAEHFFAEERLGPWWWAGPALVGVLGYGSSLLLGRPDALATGNLTGLFAPLSRPLPLDYVGAGVAGAIIGYWMTGDRDKFHTAAVGGVFGIGSLFPPESIRRVDGVAPVRPIGATDEPADRNGQSD